VIGRADFVFTIGYEGNTAVVDGSLKQKYGRYDTERLAKEGLFKQALCSAVYELSVKSAGADAGRLLEKVLEIFNAQAEQKLGSVEELKRIFGVFEVPAGIARVLVI
jgi:hypothetical protein